ncbi:uncharacterized protein LOC120003233 [Tripterygium wilfordii]|uniref:uncharacterized protein LOC120003233 n=1 Tax=Tripterygium wilfordii TaxID=458696 RepID=UPI0018F84612|nr:uncharacterized protein LOC120003233 [Tripterygium wilfordii]
MQQRKLGRPSGTDGSDFSYRMVVDSRYTKVAKGKSHLYPLIVIQALVQLIGLLTALSYSKDHDPNRVAISSIVVGFISLLIGEIGRRRSRATLLRVYIIASSAAVLLSVFCVIRSSPMLAVIQNPSDWKAKKIEVIEIARILVGLLVQIFSISITVSLIGNMSPPKKAS